MMDMSQVLGQTKQRNLFCRRCPYGGRFITILSKTSTSLQTPVKQFHHFLQAIYRNNNGRVDGTTQFRAFICLHSSHLKLEINLVAQIIKTLVFNGLLSWILATCWTMVKSTATINNLNMFLDTLNHV